MPGNQTEQFVSLFIPSPPVKWISSKQYRLLKLVISNFLSFVAASLTIPSLSLKRRFRIFGIDSNGIVHSTNRRLALELNDLLEEDIETSNIYETVYGISTLFSASAKRKVIFQDSECEYERNLMPITPFKIRWFSFVPCLERFISTLNTIIQALKEVNTLKSRSYIEKITTFKFISQVCVLYDVQRIIAKTNKLLQSSTMTLSKLIGYIRTDIETISTMYSQEVILYDDKTRWFLSLFQQKITAIGDRTLAYNDSDLEEMDAFAKNISSNILTNLNDRFNDLDQLEIWCIFDIDELKLKKKVTITPSEHIKLSQIQEFFEINRIVQGKIRFDSILTEYSQFRSFVALKAGLPTEEIQKLLWTYFEEKIPNILLLVEFYY